MTISYEQLKAIQKVIHAFRHFPDLHREDYEQQRDIWFQGLVAEVERLQNSLKVNSQIQHNFFNEAINQRDNALVEVERLRSELKKANNFIFGQEIIVFQRGEEIMNLQAENAELRKANDDLAYSLSLTLKYSSAGEA